MRVKKATSNDEIGPLVGNGPISSSSGLIDSHADEVSGSESGACSEPAHSDSQSDSWE